MNSELITKILGREERIFDHEKIFETIRDYRILITGAEGSIGQALTQVLRENEVVVHPTDIHSLDVTNATEVDRVVADLTPSHILHLAADKHAPASEVDPISTCEININGTINVVMSGEKYGCKVLTASTCKACDPETVYGSTKLISERITLNQKGSVARFYNVVETSSNVFSIWNSIPDELPILVTPCYRYFISIREAVHLVLSVLSQQDAARYTVNPGPIRFMPDIAKELYPNRAIHEISPRRGDRVQEPLKAMSEEMQELEGHILRVSSPYDLFL